MAQGREGFGERVAPGVGDGVPRPRARALGAFALSSLLLLAPDTSLADPAGDPLGDAGLRIEAPELALQRSVAAIEDHGDGRFTVPLEFVIENRGNVLLDDVQVVETLTDTFPAPATYRISSPLNSDSLAVNAGYDGASDPHLLVGANTLAPGARATIRLSVRFDPNGLPPPFEGSASATGRARSGAAASARSQGGQIRFVEAPVIGAAATLVGVTDNGDGSFDLPFTLILENLGNVDLHRLQVIEDLRASFPPPASAEIVAGPSSTPALSFHAGFDGSADPRLLQASDTLATGEAVTISYTLRVRANGSAGPFASSLLVGAQSAGGGLARDRADAGLEPDPDGDRRPDGPGEDDPIEISLGGAALRTTRVSSSPVVEPGGVVGHAVTLQNTSSTRFAAVTLADRLPAGLRYVAGSAQLLRDAQPALALGVRDGATLGFGPFALAAGETVRVRYQLRADGDLAPGRHDSWATPLSGSTAIGEGASVALQVEPGRERSLPILIGNVFHDRDGDGVQDQPDATHVTLTGRLDPGLYVPGSTTIDRGRGPELVPEGDGRSLLETGLDLGTIAGRELGHDGGQVHTVVVELELLEPFASDILLSTREGTRMNLLADGSAQQQPSEPRAAEASSQRLFAGQSLVSRDGRSYLRIEISNLGVHEEGISGVRIGTAPERVVETDAWGRFRIVDPEAGRPTGDGRISIKVDPATLPEGSRFTTDPASQAQVTPGLMSPISFGVHWSSSDSTQKIVQVKLSAAFFEPGSAQLKPSSLRALGGLAEKLRRHPRARITIDDDPNDAATADHPADLALRRAQAVRRELEMHLEPEQLRQVEIRVERSDDPPPPAAPAGDSLELLDP